MKKTVLPHEEFEALADALQLPGVARTLPWFDTASVVVSDDNQAAVVTLERYSSGELVVWLDIQLARGENGCYEFRWAELSEWNGDESETHTTDRAKGVGQLCGRVRRAYWRYSR